MTLPYSPSRAVYEGNGAATAFPFAFKVWSTDQLSVSLTSPDGLTTPAQGWTASLGENGGTLTYLHNGSPLPDGWRLAIVRDMPFAQGIDLVSASPSLIRSTRWKPAFSAIALSCSFITPAPLSLRPRS